MIAMLSFDYLAAKMLCDPDSLWVVYQKGVRPLLAFSQKEHLTRHSTTQPKRNDRMEKV